MTEFTDKSLMDMGYGQSEINAYRMKQNRELSGIAPKIDLDNDAGKISADLEHDYDSITPIQKTGASPVKIDGKNAIVDFDVPPVNDGTTPFPKHEILFEDGQRAQRQLASSVQSAPWEEREGAREKYEILKSMDPEEAQERLIEIFEDNESAINAVSVGIATDQDFDTVRQAMSPINTNAQLKNSDIEMMPDEEADPMQRIDVVGWEDEEPVFSETPKYAPMNDDTYLNALAIQAMVSTGKEHYVQDGKIVEGEGELVDLSFDEMSKLAYQSSILGKVGLIEECAKDKSKCGLMVQDFYKKAESLGDQNWYERLGTSAATFGLDFPVYSSSCALGGGIAAGAAVPAASAATAAAGPLAGGVVEAAAFSTGCWTMSLATHGAVTSVLDDILESLAYETNLDGMDVFIGAVKEFGAQAVIGFLTAKIGGGAKSLSEMIPGLTKMSRGIASPTVEFVAQGVTLAQSEHLWGKYKDQGADMPWIVDQQSLIDSVMFLGSFRLMHSMTASARRKVKGSLNKSETYIKRRLTKIQKQFGVPHEVITRYAELHPTMAKEIVDQLAEAPHIVDGKEVYMIPDMVRDMILSLRTHHARSTGTVETDGKVTTLSTNRLEEVSGRIVRKYIIQQSGTENGVAINRRSEVIFEPMENGTLRLVEVRGAVDPAKIQEIVKNDQRSILEVAEGIEGFKVEKVKEDVSDVDSAILASRLEVEDLGEMVDKLSPEAGKEVRDLLYNATEGIFGKEQITESIKRLEQAVSEEIVAQKKKDIIKAQERSLEKRVKTGFHDTEYLETIGEIGNPNAPVRKIEAPDMKAMQEGKLGEYYFLAEHASNNPNLVNMEKGFNALLHVGDNSQVGEILKRKASRTPYKVLVKVSSPLANKKGSIIHEEADLNNAESPAAIASALHRMGVITEAELVRINRSETQSKDLMQTLTDHGIDSIFYKNIGEGEGELSAIIVPENAKVLHKITKGEGVADIVESRNYHHSDPEYGAVDLSLPDIVAIAEGVLNGDMPSVAKYLGEGVRGKAAIGRTTDGIVIAAELGKDPAQLTRTLAHEIGHIVDPTIRHELVTGEKTNIVGRLISLKGHLEKYHAGRPHGEIPLSSVEKSRLREKARRVLQDELDALSNDTEIQKELGITPQQIKDIFTGVVGRAEADPAIYEFIASLNRKQKKEILRTLAHKKIPQEIQDIIDRGENRGQDKKITDAEVSKKYEELFMAEAHRRGLLVKDEIHQELYNLSKEWRPFDESAADSKYLTYRNSSAELYADFMSAFMVNPRLAKEVAPKAFDGFMEFIENNQRFLKNYRMIQEEIALHGSSGANLRRKIRRDFDEAADIRANQAKDARVTDYMSWALIDEAHGIIQGTKFAKKSGVDVSPKDNPIYKYRDMLYKNSIVELYLDKIGARIMTPARMKGATPKEFGEYLMYQRIVKGDRLNLINTRGVTLEQASRFLQELNIKHPELKDLVDEYWVLRNDTILSYLEGTDALGEELKQKILENKYYATVNVIEYIDSTQGKGSGLTLFGQVGTFKTQESPLLATIESDMALISGLLKNEAKRSAVDNLVRVRKSGIDAPREASIQKAKTELVLLESGVKIRRPIKPQDPELGLITVMRKGKVKGYYVDKFTAMAFKNNPTELVKVLQQVSRVNNYFREVYTIANPGFILVRNPLMDIHRLVMNLPSRKRDMIPYYKDVSMFLQTLTYGVPEGVRRVSGKGSARVDKMRKEMSLISVAEPWGEHEGKDPLSGLMHRFHGAESKEWNEVIKHPFNALFGSMHDLNAVMETATKVVADRYLEKHFPDMPAEERINIIRTQAGSPAHLVRGGAAVAYNNLFLFSNAMKEGYRGDWEAAKGRYGEWSYHAIMSGVIPKVVMFAMGQGYVFKGQSLEEAKINATIMSMVPERVKANYIVIPLGLNRIGTKEDGSPIYKAKVLVKPVDETSRLLGGITHKLLQQSFGITTDQKSDVGSYMGGEVPAFTPAIKVITNVMSYFINNENPIDSLTGGHIVGEDKFKAGMGDAEFYNWLWKNLGGSIFLKDNPLVDLTTPKDIVPEDDEIFVLSSISDRLIKEYDSRDLPFAIGNEIEVQKARKRVLIEAAIIKGLTEQDLNDDEIEAIATTEGREIKSKVQAIVKKGTASAWTKQYLSSDKEQKIYLKFMAARLYFDTGNLVARQFLEGLAQGDPDDFTNDKLYPAYKMMKKGME